MNDYPLHPLGIVMLVMGALVTVTIVVVWWYWL